MTHPTATRRYLHEAWTMFKASRRADQLFHHYCRACNQEISPKAAYYSKDEQARLFPDVKVIRIPKKDCPHCDAKYVPGNPGERPRYEPLYVLPPRDMCLELMRSALKDALLIRKSYTYPQGFRGETREVRRTWRRFTLGVRLKANPDAVTTRTPEDTP